MTITEISAVAGIICMIAVPLIAWGVASATIKRTPSDIKEVKTDINKLETKINKKDEDCKMCHQDLIDRAGKSNSQIEIFMGNTCRDRMNTLSESIRQMLYYDDGGQVYLPNSVFTRAHQELADDVKLLAQKLETRNEIMVKTLNENTATLDEILQVMKKEKR